MMLSTNHTPIHIYATCPQSSDVPRADYLRRVIDVAQWSEACGCYGILVYTDNSLVDPWLVSQLILQETKELRPLVAVQPVYMHPYAVAKMLATFGHLYNRQLYLNMVAGGFKNDLLALSDTTPHGKRYTRLVEYTQIIRELLKGPDPVTFKGEFYTVDKLKMTPPLPSGLQPGIFVSGSSEEGLAAARTLGATAVKYPQPVQAYEGKTLDESDDSGVRVGIIARPDAEEAWDIAHRRFPEDRKGQLTHQLAMKVSDSVWHKQLSALGETGPDQNNPYWMVPFQNYKTFCPYLVGSYERVGLELARYIKVGYKTFILDIPASEEELKHINHVFTEATKVR